MKNVAQIVAVTETLPTTGAIVWWRLGGTISYTALKEAWDDAGLDTDLLPSQTSPEVALRRAVQAQGERHRLVRRLPKGGWALIGESLDKATDDLAYRTECRVALDVLGRLDLSPADHPIAAEIRATYDAALEEVTAQDISSLLTGLAAHVKGVALREQGGIYFIPNMTVDRWRIIVRTLKSVSGHAIYEVPAMRSAEAVEAILAALTQEAQTETAKLTEALESNDLGHRALQSRAGDCAVILDKLSAYEALLDSKLDSLRERLVTLQGNLAAAALAAEVK